MEYLIHFIGLSTLNMFLLAWHDVPFEIIKSEYSRPQKLKTANIYPHVFEGKTRKFGDAKIFHFTVLYEYVRIHVYGFWFLLKLNHNTLSILNKHLHTD